MLPVIFFSLVYFGLGIAAIGEKVRSYYNFFQAVAEVMFKITGWIMYFAPFGVAGLIGGYRRSIGARVVKTIRIIYRNVLRNDDLLYFSSFRDHISDLWF